MTIWKYWLKPIDVGTPAKQFKYPFDEAPLREFGKVPQLGPRFVAKCIHFLSGDIAYNMMHNPRGV